MCRFKHLLVPLPSPPRPVLYCRAQQADAAEARAHLWASEVIEGGLPEDKLVYEQFLKHS